MLTSAQLRAARALLGLDQRTLAEMAGVSVQTIQRMEASEGVVRGVVDSLMKVVAAIEAAGVELIAEDAPSTGRGRGVRLREPASSGVSERLPPSPAPPSRARDRPAAAAAR